MPKCGKAIYYVGRSSALWVFFVIQSVILSLDWSFCHSIGDLVVKFVVYNYSIMGEKTFPKLMNAVDRPVEPVSRYLQYW